MPDGLQIKLSLIWALAKNEASNMEACMEAVSGQKGVGAIEVIVVDSGSTDGTQEIARRYAARLEEIAAKPIHHAQGIMQPSWRRGEFWCTSRQMLFLLRMTGSAYC